MPIFNYENLTKRHECGSRLQIEIALLSDPQPSIVPVWFHEIERIPTTYKIINKKCFISLTPTGFKQFVMKEFSRFLSKLVKVRLKSSDTEHN